MSVNYPPRDLPDLLEARRGIVCAVGAGGKKSTLYQLMRQLDAKVAFTTTVFTVTPPPDLAEHSVVAEARALEARLPALRDAQSVVFAGPSEKPDRIGPVAATTVAGCHALLERDVTLVKADGARMRWIKAPNPGEPVIPPGCTTVLPILSVGAIGRPLSDKVAHRPELVSAVTGLAPDSPIEPQHLAALLTEARGVLQHSDDCTIVPVLNMVDTPERLNSARTVAELALAATTRFDRVVLAAMNRSDPIVAVVE